MWAKRTVFRVLRNSGLELEERHTMRYRARGTAVLEPYSVMR